MKIKLLLTLMVALLAYSSSYASFPVKRTVNTEANTEVTANDSETIYTAITSSTAEKDLVVGVLLWILLGWPFAAHRWYYGKPVWANILFIITFGGLGVWWVIDGINILTEKW